MERILCLGAAHWDLIARAGAPLAPGADVPGRAERRLGGVALNVALALAGLGGRPVLMAAVGRDGAGDALIAAATARGVDCAQVLRPAGPSDSYLAIEDADGQLFAAVADCAGLESAALRPALAGGFAGIRRAVVDGNLPEPLLAEIASGGALAGMDLAFVSASPGKAARMAVVLACGRGTLYLNRREVEAICGSALTDSAGAAAALRARGMPEVVVTDGAFMATHDGAGGVVSRLPPRVGGGVTGAGDAFVAAHLVARAAGCDLGAALEAALGAAARHITREAP